ncbi:MAG: hypothetical protein KDK96_11080 [Chlamydiia bacterium]|nr:hypothetical protein [Chlamydiia bacterium]
MIVKKSFKDQIKRGERISKTASELFLSGYRKKVCKSQNLICLGILAFGCMLSGCSTVKTMADQATSSFKEDWNRTSDKNNLARVESSLRWGSIGEAWKFANKLHFPENRAEALRLIALCEKNPQGEFQPREETLSQLKVAIDQISEPKEALYYELSLVELTFQLNPENARKDLKTCEKKIWEIASAQERAPFLIRIVSFELETAKNLEAAKKAISVAKNTIQMIAIKQIRESQENELALIIESHSNVLCSEK